MALLSSRRFRDFVRKISDESGSIAVIVIGLFVITVASLMVMTDVSTLIVAKRSLVQATEAAAQRGVHTLDKSSYYQGKANMFTVPLAIATQRAHPVIPIDCKAASSRASETLADIANTSNHNYNGSGFRSDDSNNVSTWSDRLFGGSNKQLLRRELSDVRISEFQCNGTEVLITATAKAWLPISLSLFSFESVDLSASAGTTSVKKRVLSIFGINF